MSAAFAQDTADAAKGQWRKVADQVRPNLPKLAGLLDEAETDVLAYMSFPARPSSQAALDQPVGAAQRRDQTPYRGGRHVGFAGLRLPNEAAIVRLVGAILLEQNDEWMVQRSRYLSRGTMATLSDNPLVSLTDMAA